MTTKVEPIKPERVCIGDLSDGHGRYCALGWRDRCGVPEKLFNKNYTEIFSPGTKLHTESRVVQINDERLTNRQDRAALINATLKRMGYDIPLAATVGKTILKKGYRKN
jgi:hypothetical protein